MLYTDNIGLKKPAYSEPADIADINENMDTIDREFGNRYLKSETYSVEQANNAIAQAIEALPNGLVYRGAVNYYKDLPTANNELGDTYSVKYQGETGTTADGNEYAWGEYDGTFQWIKLGVNAYTKNEIDEQLSVVKSDILTVKNDIAINQNTLGVQCKNLIPQEVEMGFYDDTTGAPMSGGTLIRVIGYAKVKPNTKYTISSNLKLFTIWRFNGNDKIDRTSAIQNNSYTMTTPNNCNSLRICLDSPNDNVSDFEWIQVEEGTVATEYEPYKPSLQEQINALVERIQALETAQTATK